MVKSIKRIGVIALAEQFTSEVEDKKITFPKDLGAEHPFKFEEAESIYEKFGFVTGAIDKYVDNIVDNFQVKVKNPNVKAIIYSFLKDSNLKIELRNWVREALVKGNGFMEIDLKNNKVKTINANNMFVVRDNKGEILAYNQLTTKLRGSVKYISFTPNQIAHLKFNAPADAPYGLGLIYPNMVEINRLFSNLNDLQKIISRKGGAPIHVKVGVQGQAVNPADIQSFYNDLQYMNNRTEWVTDANTEIKVVDFGNISDKFADIIVRNLELLYAGFQIPEVLMGSGQLNEGIAKVQLEGFQRRIHAIQDEIEVVIINKIFRPILLGQANKQFDEYPEITWALPGETEVNDRIDRIQRLLSVMGLSENMRRMLEIELAQALDVPDYDKFLKIPEVGLEEDEEKKQEEEIQQPEVPTAKPNANQISHNHIEEAGDMTIQEWVSLPVIEGFKYSDFVTAILKNLKKDGFTNLKAITEQDLELGLLDDNNIEKLRQIMKDGFKKNLTISQIEKDIRDNVNLGDRFILNESGEKVLSLGAEYRPNNIARTETVRLANTGLIKHYQDNDVKEVRFLAALSDRTCDECADLNSQVYDIKESSGIIPVHSNCRCTWIPVTSLETA